MVETLELPFFAGLDDSEQPVFESLRVEVLDADRQIVRLLHSPLLVRSLAAGDHLRVIDPATASYELERRSGNLCVRVMRKTEVSPVAEELVPRLEKLGGKLDLHSERALIFSVHFSIGFSQIEAILDEVCGRHQDTVWYYGNVYDPEDGVTPLRWWEDFDSLE